jgi:hypothetical protein
MLDKICIDILKMLNFMFCGLDWMVVGMYFNF